MHHYNFAMNIEMWTVSIIHPSMKHYGDSGMANIQRCLYSFKVLMYAVEHQKWPSNHSLFSPINK